jgi:hypothetical protein
LHSRLGWQQKGSAQVLFSKMLARFLARFDVLGVYLASPAVCSTLNHPI